MALEFRIVLDNADAIRAAKDEQVQAALEAVGIQAQSHAQNNITAGVPRWPSWYTPTGDLRNSMEHEVVGNDTVVIGTDLEYAIYNEMGTGKFAEGGGSPPWKYMGSDGQWHYTEGITPLHFLRDAMQDHLDEYKQIIEQYLRG